MATLNTPTEEDDYFYEDLDADFSQSLGDFKTENPVDNRFQRRFVHLSRERSRFKKTTELVLCIHGWDDVTAKSPTPMTLVVLGISLHCHDKDFRFQSVTIRLKFLEDDQPDSDAGKANPEIVAFAPFVRRQIWNVSEADHTDNVEYGGSLGAEYGVNLGADARISNGKSFTRRYFDKGTAVPLVDERTSSFNGVEWYCEQNGLTDYGIEPYFQVAVLVKRKHTKDGGPITFRAVYDMKIDAGFRYNFDEGMRRIFRLQRREDAPIYFNPAKEEPEVNGMEGEGQRLLQCVDKNRMATLAEAYCLSKLLDPISDGQHSLDPLKPM